MIPNRLETHVPHAAGNLIPRELPGQAACALRAASAVFCAVLVLLCTAAVAAAPVPAAPPAAPAPHVWFDRAGIVYVNDRPFFPVGLFTYSLDDTVMAEMHQLQFNTVIMLTEHHKPEQLDYVQRHGLMAIAPPSPDWLRIGITHPSLLAWYLSDEPEGHGLSAADARTKYLALKAEDPNHPIGLDHFLWEGLETYKAACDFTMTDVYPITAKRDVPITNVGKFIDEARRIHGPGWPHWTYIQIFGGPDTDGGKWAQPLPDEVRCMTYIALVHRSTGILYFAYWAKVPRTWNSIGPLNTEINRISPWLVAPGDELPVKSSVDAVQVRAKRVKKGGIVLIVNTTSSFVDAQIHVPEAPTRNLSGLFDAPKPRISHGDLIQSLGPYETRVYTWGSEPDILLAHPPALR